MRIDIADYCMLYPHLYLLSQGVTNCLQQNTQCMHDYLASINNILIMYNTLGLSEEICFVYHFYFRTHKWECTKSFATTYTSGNVSSGLRHILCCKFVIKHIESRKRNGFRPVVFNLLAADGAETVHKSASEN